MPPREPTPWEKKAVRQLRTVRRQLAEGRRVLSDPAIPEDIKLGSAFDNIWNMLQELRLSTGIEIERRQRGARGNTDNIGRSPRRGSPST